MAHPADAVVPPRWPSVRLGEKTVTLKYGHLAKVVLEKRHGNDLDGFVDDLRGAFNDGSKVSQVEATVLLAGMAWMPNVDIEDPTLLDEMADYDSDAISVAALAGVPALLRALGFTEAEDEGEADGGDAEEQESLPSGPASPGPQPSGHEPSSS